MWSLFSHFSSFFLFCCSLTCICRRWIKCEWWKKLYNDIYFRLFVLDWKQWDIRNYYWDVFAKEICVCVLAMGPLAVNRNGMIRMTLSWLHCSGLVRWIFFLVSLRSETNYRRMSAKNKICASDTSTQLCDNDKYICIIHIWHMFNVTNIRPSDIRDSKYVVSNDLNWWNWFGRLSPSIISFDIPL